MVTDHPMEWTMTLLARAAGLGRQRQIGVVANDDRVDWTSAYRVLYRRCLLCSHAGTHASEVARGLEASGFQIRSQIIWAKQHFALSRGDYHWQHEPCWYAVRSGKTSNWCGDRTQSTLWEVANLNPFGRGKGRGDRSRNTKACGTDAPAHAESHRPGRDCLRSFPRPGTTLIAAQMTERACFGLDIDPHYVDLV